MLPNDDVGTNGVRCKVRRRGRGGMKVSTGDDALRGEVRLALPSSPFTGEGGISNVVDAGGGREELSAHEVMLDGTRASIRAACSSLAAGEIWGQEPMSKTSNEQHSLSSSKIMEDQSGSPRCVSRIRRRFKWGRRNNCGKRNSLPSKW